MQPPPPSVARDPSQPSPFTRNTTGPLKLVLPASLLNNSHASKVGVDIIYSIYNIYNIYNIY